MIDVDKWWPCVNDLVRDWICLLCYVRTVIAWYVWNGGQFSCDVNILRGICLCVMHEMLMFVYSNYDWCEANPQWFVVDRLPICMNE